jgi:GT2 family glycosyltransferase
MYYEDIDLCSAAKRAGGRVWRDPAWRVIHLGGYSARRDHLTALKRSYQAARNYHQKWHGGALAFTGICLVEAVLKSAVAVVAGHVGTTTRSTQLALTGYLFRQFGAEGARATGHR